MTKLNNCIDIANIVWYIKYITKLNKVVTIVLFISGRETSGILLCRYS